MRKIHKITNQLTKENYDKLTNKMCEHIRNCIVDIEKIEHNKFYEDYQTDSYYTLLNQMEANEEYNNYGIEYKVKTVIFDVWSFVSQFSVDIKNETDFENKIGFKKGDLFYKYIRVDKYLFKKDKVTEFNMPNFDVDKVIEAVNEVYNQPTFMKNKKDGKSKGNF